jgi:phosphatidylserine decarboxylase
MYEGRWIFLILVIASIVIGGPALSIGRAFGSVASTVCSWISIICSGLVFFSFWFFRDPERPPPADPSLVASPADGTVTLVDEVEEEQLFKRRMKRVSIFLSVFDVHVNRTPISGEVLFTEARGGLYLDARKPEASVLNESLFWAFGSRDRPEKAVGVKLITGAIARRIVPWARLGEKMERGERFAMIRFGSRTDLFLPLDAEVLVSVGQKVKGCETALARMAS